MPSWTAEQERAITEKGNLLVSAAAGAGKTAVMTERIARLIAQGTSVRELLVVTFTNAAAAEMKQRIEQRLTELADMERDETVRLRLYDAASDIGSASISTIHSFCGDVLRHNPHLVGLDPSFRTADEAEAALMRAEAMDSVIENAYARAEKQDEGFRRLSDRLGGDEMLSDSIGRLYRFIIARPDPMGWLDGAANAYGEGFDDYSALACRELVGEAHRAIKAMKGEAERLRHELRGYGDMFVRYFETMDRDSADLTMLEKLNDYDGYCYALKEFSFSPLPRSPKGSTTPPLVDGYRKGLKKQMAKLQKSFSMSLDEEKAIARQLSPSVTVLCELVKDFMKEYSRLKQEAAVIDFDDMQQLCYEALKNEDAAEEYRKRFKYIFVDEYQDTSGVQDAIIAAVSRGDNLFMVGDVKQSIYRFRQAEPENFLRKYNTYDGTMGTRIDLNANFRSKTSVLNATNRLFSLIMLGDVGEIDYSDNNALICGVSAGSGSVELALISLESGTATAAREDAADTEDMAADDGDESEDLEGAEAEALYAVERIREFIAEGSIFDKSLGRERKPVYSDFAVLMRKTAGAALTWVNTLTRCGIPCTAELGDGYFDAIEVQVFINLLRIIDNRRQDIPMMSVMRSPICAFTSEEIVYLKTEYEGEALLDRLMLAAGNTESSCGRKAGKLLADIDNWREYVRSSGVEALVGRLLNETDYYSFVGILPGGAVRQANLEKLIERAGFYESSSAGGLHGFIMFLDGMRDNTSVGAMQTPAVDAVRIMSIHKSKGLEFPVVFIAGLSAQFSRRDGQAAVITDGELGIGIRPRGLGPNGREPLLRRAAAAKAASKLNAEEMRILYVGMTRAKEKLFMVGANKRMRKCILEWASPMSAQRISNAHCFLDWLLGAYCPLGLNLETAANGAEINIGSDTMTIRFMESDVLSYGGLAADGISERGYREWTEKARTADTKSFSELVNFDYPFGADTAAPAKRSVSDFLVTDYEYSPAVPAFMQGERKLSSAERGTAAHSLIMNLPLTMHDRSSVERIVSELASAGKLSEAEAESIYIKGILNLTDSELWRRIIRSPRVERELEFTLLDDGGGLVQGMIDCCFVEEGGWVVVDYKTTAVHADKAGCEAQDGVIADAGRAVAEGYAPQLDAYAAALNAISGLPVREKWVYLLGTGRAYRLD